MKKKFLLIKNIYFELDNYCLIISSIVYLFYFLYYSNFYFEIMLEMNYVYYFEHFLGYFS